MRHHHQIISEHHHREPHRSSSGRREITVHGVERQGDETGRVIEESSIITVVMNVGISSSE
jgi:hypothetical protein